MSLLVDNLLLARRLDEARRQHVAHAHGGTPEARSTPRRSATFTVAIPFAR